MTDLGLHVYCRYPHYSPYLFTNFVTDAIDKHDPDRPLFVYFAMQTVSPASRRAGKERERAGWGAGARARVGVGLGFGQVGGLGGVVTHSVCLFRTALAKDRRQKRH